MVDADPHAAHANNAAAGQPAHPHNVPNDSDFQQQRLKAWQPAPTPKGVVLTYVLLGVIFIPLGAALLHASTTAHDDTTRYDTACPNVDHDNPGYCTFNLTVSHDMTPPIYFYYKLGNFYQNHRRYVTSESIYQLHGDSNPDLSTCSPEQWEYIWIASQEYAIYPCGAIAGTYFNDTFSVSLLPRGDSSEAIPLGNPTSDPSEESWSQAHVAYGSDLNTLYSVNLDYLDEGASREGTFGFTIPFPNTTDFAVWQRVSALPIFKKLYRAIRCVPPNSNTPCTAGGQLKAGDVLQVTVANNYDVSAFSGSKSVVISTTSWLGGTNNFLGIAWLVVGGLFFLLALVFGISTLLFPPPAVTDDIKIFNVPGGGQLTMSAQQKRATVS